MNESIAGKISPLAGKPAPLSLLVDVSKLVTAYYTEVPDPSIQSQRVHFGTSGHRGSSFDLSFNEWHILAITQAICLYRRRHKVDGPLFLGMDTHALSKPAFASALEVLAANGVEVMVAGQDEYTPTPVISHAILTCNRGRTSGLADGIVITPSHNPPRDGGFKYNPTTGGPAGLEVTNWIEKQANEFLENKLNGVKRVRYEQALRALTTHRHDYLNNYINDLVNVIDVDAIRSAQIQLGVDPLGGAGVHYWEPVAQRYGLDLTVVNNVVDPTFRFMTVDWDGQIRMNPASNYAMVNLIKLKDRFDIAFACDTDHDRHGIVTRKAGLLAPNHYLSVALAYLFTHRPCWPKAKGAGKTVVTTQMLNRIAANLGRHVYEVPVGFKWYVDGLLDGSLQFCAEESAGAVFSRLDGSVWTSDKDGITLGLLAAEICAKLDRDPGDIYQDFETEFGKTFFAHNNSKANAEQKEKLKKMSASDVRQTDLAGDQIDQILTKAPGNDAPIEGLKVISKNGWFVIRPSGTEDLVELYAESFLSEDHLQQIVGEAQTIMNNAFGTSTE